MAKRKPTPAKTETPSTEPPTPTRVRRSVSPELAATIREEDESHAATIQTAQAIAAVAVAEANRLIERAHARHRAAMRPILRSLQIDDGKFLAVDGFGADITVEIEIPGASNA